MIATILDMGLLRYLGACAVVAATLYVWLMIGALVLPMLLEV